MSSQSSLDKLLAGFEKVLTVVGPAKEELLSLQNPKVGTAGQNVETTLQKAKLLNELDVVQEDNARLANAIEKQRQVVIAAEIDKRNCQSELDVAKKTLEDERKVLNIQLASTKTSLDQKTEDMQKERTKADQCVKDLNDLKDLAARQKKEDLATIKRLKKQIQSLEKDKHDVQTRLSVVLAKKQQDTKLLHTDNVNGIHKVVGMYNELYDNQWTEAFEKAHSLFPNKSERDRIVLLRRIFQQAYRFCQKEKEAFTADMCRALNRSDEKQSNTLQLPAELQNGLIDCMRYCAVQDLQESTKRFNDSISADSELSRLACASEKYTRRCVEVCWLMVMQNPTLSIHNVDACAVFDNTYYKAYSTSGNQVEYLVWPALLAHENGPALSKGVVECFKSPPFNSTGVPGSGTGNEGTPVDPPATLEPETRDDKLMRKDHNTADSKSHEDINKKSISKNQNDKNVKPEEKGKRQNVSITTAATSHSPDLEEQSANTDTNSYPPELVPTDKDLSRFNKCINVYSRESAVKVLGEKVFEKCEKYIEWMKRFEH